MPATKITIDQKKYSENILQAETFTSNEHHGLFVGLLWQPLWQLPVGVLEAGAPPGDVILGPAVQGKETIDLHTLP